MKILYHPNKVKLGFFPFVAPANFDRTIQPVDIYTVFKAYFRTNANAKYIYSFTSSIDTLSLSAATGVSYRWGETIGGVDYVYDVVSGTAFTTGSTNRYVIVNNTSTSAMGGIAPTGAVWIYYGHLIKGISSKNNNYLNYIHLANQTSLTSVGTGAEGSFDGCSNLTGLLTIPDTVTSIAGVSFRGCSKLTGECRLPDGVTTLGGYTFNYCTGFTSLDLNNLVSSSIGMNWNGCSGLTGTLIIPDSCKVIGGSDFVGTKFTSIQWGNSIENIGGGAFQNITTLNMEWVFPSTIKTIGASAFNGCINLYATSFNIPASLTSIETCAFLNCNITGTLTIPSTLTAISEGAFSGTGLHTFVSNNPTYEVDDKVLYNVSTKTSLGAERDYADTLTLRSDTVKIGSYCFYKNKRTGSLTIPASVLTIATYAFHLSASFIGNLTIPDTVTSLLGWSFSSCTGFNGTLYIGTGITSLGERDIFSGCTGLTGDLVLHDGLKTVGTYDLAGLNGINGNIVFGSGLTTNYNYAFGLPNAAGSLTIRKTDIADYSSSVVTFGKITALNLPASYTGAWLTFTFSKNLSGASLDASIKNITDGTKTVTIGTSMGTDGSNNMARLLAYNPNAVTDAAARGITIV